MARQPFLPIYRDRGFDLGPDSVASNPRLAALIGSCVSHWSHVELQLGLVMGCMIGVENPASVAVFGSLKNHRAQREALAAAAKHSLDDESRDIFDAILSVHSRLDGQRNDVVHGLWANINGDADAALWISTQDYANHLIRAYHQDIKRDSVGFENETQRLTGLCFVWPYRDIEKLNAEISKFAELILFFHVHLRHRNRPYGWTGALDQLRSSALLQEALANAKGSKNP